MMSLKALDIWNEACQMYSVKSVPKIIPILTINLEAIYEVVLPIIENMNQ